MGIKIFTCVGIIYYRTILEKNVFTVIDIYHGTHNTLF